MKKLNMRKKLGIEGFPKGPINYKKITDVLMIVKDLQQAGSLDPDEVEDLAGNLYSIFGDETLSDVILEANEDNTSNFIQIIGEYLAFISTEIELKPRGRELLESLIKVCRDPDNPKYQIKKVPLETLRGPGKEKEKFEGEETEVTEEVGKKKEIHPEKGDLSKETIPVPYAAFLNKYSPDEIWDIVSGKKTDVSEEEIEQAKEVISRGIVANRLSMRKTANGWEEYKKRQAEKLKIAENPNTPPKALAELVNNSDWNIREALAGNPNTPPEALTKLVEDKNLDVRLALAENPNTPPKALAELALIELSKRNWNVLHALMENPSTPPETLAKLQDRGEYIEQKYKRMKEKRKEFEKKLREDVGGKLMDQLIEKGQNPKVWTREKWNAFYEEVKKLKEEKRKKEEEKETKEQREERIKKEKEDKKYWENIEKAVNLAENPNTPSEVLVDLSKNHLYNVRRQIAKNPSTPIEVLVELAKDKDWTVLFELAGNLNTPPEILVELLRNRRDMPIREALAENPNTPPKALAELARSQSNSILYALLENPNTPPEALVRLKNRGFYKEEEEELEIEEVEEEEVEEEEEEIHPEKGDLSKETIPVPYAAFLNKYSPDEIWDIVSGKKTDVSEEEIEQAKEVISRGIVANRLSMRKTAQWDEVKNAFIEWIEYEGGPQHWLEHYGGDITQIHDVIAKWAHHERGFVLTYADVVELEFLFSRLLKKQIKGSRKDIANRLSMRKTAQSAPETIQKAQQGDKDAIAKVIEENESLIASSLIKWGLTPGSDDFQDTLSDIKVEMLNRVIPQYDSSKGAFSTFLTTAVYNFLRRGTRKKEYEEKQKEVSTEEPTGEDITLGETLEDKSHPLVQMTINSARENLQSYIHTKNPELEDMILRIFDLKIEDNTHEQIAETLNKEGFKSKGKPITRFIVNNLVNEWIKPALAQFFEAFKTAKLGMRKEAVMSDIEFWNYIDQIGKDSNKIEKVVPEPEWKNFVDKFSNFTENLVNTDPSGELRDGMDYASWGIISRGKEMYNQVLKDLKSEKVTLIEPMERYEGWKRSYKIFDNEKSEEFGMVVEEMRQKTKESIKPKVKVKQKVKPKTKVKPDSKLPDWLPSKITIEDEELELDEPSKETIPDILYPEYSTLLSKYTEDEIWDIVSDKKTDVSKEEIEQAKEVISRGIIANRLSMRKEGSRE